MQKFIQRHFPKLYRRFYMRPCVHCNRLTDDQNIFGTYRHQECAMKDRQSRGFGVVVVDEVARWKPGSGPRS